METQELSLKEWTAVVPDTITSDPLWSVEAYRLGLYVADTSWPHVQRLIRNPGTRSLGNQLHRSAGSVPGNISEGYSRSSPLERARFYEFALGSSRESRDWYFLGRHILGAAVAEQRTDLLTQIIKLLTRMVRQPRSGRVREDEQSYDLRTDGHQIGELIEPTPPSGLCGELSH
jgi:four helix bundle protein